MNDTPKTVYRSTNKENTGHTFIAEYNNNSLKLLDPQKNNVYYDYNSISRILKGTIKYWRIDDLEVSQTGINACERIKR